MKHLEIYVVAAIAFKCSCASYIGWSDSLIGDLTVSKQKIDSVRSPRVGNHERKSNPNPITLTLTITLSITRTIT